jgi:TRAP-type mannitol/chloroaromatic compound transport system substrate-binding protein
MKRFLRSSFLASSLAVAWLAGSAAHAADITWRLQSVAGAGTNEYKNLVEKFAQYTKELTEGKVQIKTYPAGMLMKSSEVPEAVSKGVLDVGHTYLVYMSGKDPALKAVNEWPAQAHPLQGVMWFYEGGGADLMRKIVGKHNMYFLGVAPILGEQIWSTKAIRTVEDLQGIKMRGAGLAGDSFARLGASVVAMPGEEIYQGLQRGVIDAVEFTTMPVNFGLGFHEVAKYVMLPSYSAGATADFVINAKAWSKVPKELQPKIEQALQLAGYEYYRSAMIEEAEITEKLKKSGVELVRWSDEEMQKLERARIAVMKERYAADSPAFAEKFDSQLEFLKRLGYQLD